MKLNALIAAVVFGIGLFAGAPANAQVFTPDEEPPQLCQSATQTGCRPVGHEACTTNGCYQMYCNDIGCNLLFKPRNPFPPRYNEP